MMIRRMRRGRAAAFLATLALTALACGADPRRHEAPPTRLADAASAAPSASTAASSASIAVPQSEPPRCEGVTCVVSFLDDAGAKLLAARADRDKLRVVVVAPTAAGMESLARIPWLTSLEARGPVDDLGPIARLPALRNLELVSVRAASLEPLSGLRALLSLRIGCDGVRDADLRALRNLRELATLKVAGCALTSAEPLGALPKLDDVELTNTAVGSLEGLRGSKLRTLRVQGGPSDVSALASMSELWRLELIDLPNASDFSALASLRALERLDLNATGITRLPKLAATELKHASFAQSTALKDVTGLAGLAALEDVDLSGTGVSDLRPLAQLRELGVVYVIGAKVTDLSPLAKARNLKAVHVGDDAPEAMKAALRRLRPDVAVRTETEARHMREGPR